MEAYKRDFFIARIRAGYISVEIDKQRFTIHHPNDDMALIAQEKYIEAYEQAQENELLSNTGLLDFLIIQGIWSDEIENEYQKILPGHIDYWKIELYQSTLKSNTRKKVRQYLKAAKEEYNRLANIRHHYDYTTVDGYANFIRSMYILSECTRLNGECVDWSKYNLSTIMGKYHSSLLSADNIRELSRTSPWTNLWSVVKISGNIFNNDILTIEQQSLLSWSVMYDKIYESPDCPHEDVISDDDMLDGWLLLQKKQREADKKKQEVEEHINPRLQNADEIYVPAETASDAQKIDLLNPVQIQKIKKQRMSQIKDKGTVSEQEFKDVQLNRSMQMQQAYNQSVKGK